MGKAEVLRYALCVMMMGGQPKPKPKPKPNHAARTRLAHPGSRFPERGAYVQ